MAENSKIEWTDSTWNPITGCSIVSPGCTHCYAMKLAGTRLKHHPSRKGLTTMTKTGPVWNGKVRFNEGWLTQPLQWSRPRMVFVCAHGDLFHEDVPDEWIDRVFVVMGEARRHTFQVLTKRADRMRRYVTEVKDKRAIMPGAFTWPLPNVRLGVSAERQKEADERIPDLLLTPAATRFVSLEPLLGPIDLLRTPRVGQYHDWLTGERATAREKTTTPSLDWIIVGGESGDGASPMHPSWVRSLRDQCTAAGKLDRFFFKQWGAWREPIGDEDFDTSKGRTGKPPAFIVSLDGTVHCFQHVGDDDRPVMIDVGKKAAGRMLDGVEYNGMPA